jgi:radical SAM protein with 4Fe4S-binding SPASM domain
MISFPNSSTHQALTLPNTVVSKSYRLADGRFFAIAYNTRAQTAAILEDDSARVWWLLYQDRGDTRRALEHILANGTFQTDRATEAAECLSVFAQELARSRLVVSSSEGVYAGTPVFSGEGADPTRSIESAISQLMADNHVFYGLTIELTYRCNETCVHCYCPAEREGKELTVDEIEQLLDEFEALGGFQLLLTGGEVFLRRDIKRILRGLRNRRLLVGVNSNLTLVDDESLDLLAELAPKAVGCSIYSAEAATHDSVTRVPGSFAKSMNAIRMLKKLGVPVIMKSPLMSHTIQGWKAIDALASDTGCECEFDLSISARNDGGLSPILTRSYDEAAIAELLNSRFERIHINGEPVVVSQGAAEEVLLCGAGGAGLTISPDGTIRPCIGLMTALGRWPNNPLASVWTESAFFRDWSNRRLSDLEPCRTCAKVGSCIRCPGAWAVESGDFLKPSQYTCFLAEVRSRCQNDDGGWMRTTER